MKKTILIIAITVCAITLYAQDKGLNKQVDVVRDYVPAIEAAKKLNIEPVMVDTVTLKPEISYSIRPNAFTSSFGLEAFSPVQVNANEYKVLTPFYLKAGGGYPLNSLLDFYMSSTDNRKGSYGAYINHKGSYADIKNDVGIDRQALDFRGSLGAFGKKKVGQNLVLGGELGYDHLVADRYGEFAGSTNPVALYDIINRARFSTTRANASFGHDFTDMTMFNFRLGAGTYYFGDKFYNAETGLDLFAEIGKAFDEHEALLKFKYEGHFGQRKINDYTDNIFTVSPRYRLNGEKFKLAVGADVSVDKQDIVWFFPDLKLTLDITNGYFVPYVDISGRLNNNGYRNTVGQNPYVKIGYTMENTAEFNFTAGITGSISSQFAYKAYVGGTIFDNYNTFVNVVNEFIGLTDNISRITIGGDLEGRITRDLQMLLSAHVYGYKTSYDNFATGLPSADVALHAKYNYRDKLFIKAGATLLGKRYFNELRSIPTEDGMGFNNTMFKVAVDPVIDVNIEAQYKINKTWGAFLSLNNLAGSKLYPFNHYNSTGTGFTAGVILNF